MIVEIKGCSLHKTKVEGGCDFRLNTNLRMIPSRIAVFVNIGNIGNLNQAFSMLPVPILSCLSKASLFREIGSLYEKSLT